MARPVIFLGSSTEGLDVAKAIQQNLDHCAECIIWHQGVFGLSQGSLESLVQKLDDFDFAILVLTPDDLVMSRGETRQTPRDNVLLELGLFIGRIGRERTYIVCDRDAELKLPSDLAGITPATFQRPAKGTFQSALGAACTQLESLIGELGSREGRRWHALKITFGLFQNVRREEGFTVTVENLDLKSLPPAKLGICHPKLGRWFIFPSEKTGELLPEQQRDYHCPMLKGGQLIPHRPSFTDDVDGSPLSAEDDDDFAFRIVLEDSEKVLYESKRIGKAFVQIWRQVRQAHNFAGVTGKQWDGLLSEFDNDTS